MQKQKKNAIDNPEPEPKPSAKEENGTSRQ